MSEYSDYGHRMASDYDHHRVPVGVDIIKQHITPNMKVLDAGCGTGNYIKELSPFVDKIIGVDISKSMLSHVKKKINKYKLNNVTLIESSILHDNLPFKAKEFDVILLNQVLQHLTKKPDPTFSSAKKVIGILLKYLKTSGALIINLSTPEQISNIWWLHLIPRVLKQYQAKSVPLPILTYTLSNYNYRNFKFYNIVEPMQGYSYFNLMGPLDTKWRNSSSKWKMAKKEEIKKAQDKVIHKIKEGTMGEYFDNYDFLRCKQGLSTLLIAKSFNSDK